MRTKLHFLFLVLALFAGVHHAAAQGTAFTYQGQLYSGANPASGTYNLTFSLYNAGSGGGLVGGPLTNSGVGVTNGLFTVTIDFGATPFMGASNWLQIAVATNGSGTFTNLTPRQQVTPTPYALFAGAAGNVTGMVNVAQLSGTIPVTNLSGTLSLAQLPPSVVTNGASGVNISGTFSGNGAGVTNVNVATLQENLAVVAGWGDDSFGETSIPAGLGNVVAIAAGGGYFNLALKSDGTVVGWGNNNYGETTIPAGLNNVVAISTSAWRSRATERSSGGDTMLMAKRPFPQA